MGFFNGGLLAIPCKCETCNTVTLWGFKEILKRDKDQSIVHCSHCGAGKDYSKWKMIKTFIREDIRVRFGR